MFQHVGAAIDDGLEQTREDAHAILQIAFGYHSLCNAIKGWKRPEVNGHQDLGSDHESDRREMGLIFIVEPDRRRTQIERLVIEDQPARRLDLAERLLGGDADVEPLFNECRLLIGGIQEVDPDNFGRELGAWSGRWLEAWPTGRPSYRRRSRKSS